MNMLLCAYCALHSCVRWVAPSPDWRNFLWGVFMGEIWKDVAGYEGLYQVSNNGRIRNAKGLIMSQKPSKDGYVRILLFKKGKYKAEYIHILVAKEFVEKPSAENLEVNHIDGDKANNNYLNLEWVTKSQNTLHAIQNNLRFVNPIKGKFGQDNPLSKAVLQFDNSGNLINRWGSALEAANAYGYNKGSIRSCAGGYKKTYKGYVWRYEDSVKP